MDFKRISIEKVS